MADTVWETGIKQMVFVPVGRNDAGRMRLRAANFEVVRWASQLNGLVETYIVPRGIATLQQADLSTVDRDIDLMHEFGFYGDLDDIIVEAHQADGSDSLVGLHSFGTL